MVEPLSLLSALLLGLFGASHCLIMCGGIAAALGTARSPSMTHRLSSTLMFNLGRISSYALAGALSGALGLWLQQQHQLFAFALRSLAGVLLVLMGLYVARWSTWLTHIEGLGQGIWKMLQPRAQTLMTEQGLLPRFLLGMLWGWLPCGLIYSTLSWVAANGDPVSGALAMLSFGAGTLPALFASSLASAYILRALSHKHVKHLAGISLILYGLWTLLSIWLPLLH